MSSHGERSHVKAVLVFFLFFFAKPSRLTLYGLHFNTRPPFLKNFKLHILCRAVMTDRGNKMAIIVSCVIFQHTWRAAD